MPLYRPPSEGDNLIIQATIGCSFNRCSFCAMYRSKTYQARPLEAVKQDIDIAAAANPNARRVFLADGDALALDTEQLQSILQHLAVRLPKLTRVSCYATPANLLRKSHDELLQLRQHKLSLLYFGIETGSPDLLKRINKGATRQGMITALQKAHDANMKVSATVILGLGGKDAWQAHIDATAALLSEAPVTYLSTLQLYLDPSIREAFANAYDKPFDMPDDSQILDEQQRFISRLNPPQRIIFRSNHASNALALAGNLPQDRDALLRQIEEARDGIRPLRPSFMRSL